MEISIYFRHIFEVPIIFGLTAQNSTRGVKTLDVTLLQLLTISVEVCRTIKNAFNFR